MNLVGGGGFGDLWHREMEGEVDAGVVNPIFFPGRFSDSSGMARKRDMPCFNPIFQQSHHWLMGSGLPNPNCSNSWNSKAWDWDSVRFTAKLSQDLQGNGAEQWSKEVESGKAHLLSKEVEKHCEGLSLKVGDGACEVEELVRPSKRVRSGSPGSAATYPICQVDDCKENLSNAKDYHRRHKVCELHSKTAKAIVGNQMQRFCQQCSRFHPLMEFDEGKRSCRRRLAGHNRRRRKTPPENASPNMLDDGSQEGKTSGSVDIVNLLAILARLQGNTDLTSISEGDRLLQMLAKIGSLPSANAPSKTYAQGGFDLNISEAPKLQSSQQCSSKQLSQEGWNPNSPSTMNLLAVLSAALASSSPNAPTTLSQGITDGNGNRSTSACQDTTNNIGSDGKLTHTFPSCEGRGAKFNDHSLFNSSEHQVKVSTTRIPLQLFGSSEDDSPPKFGSASKYPSSQSSNPTEDGSPSCSPNAVKMLFPMHSASGEKDETRLRCREDLATAEASTTCGWASAMKPYEDPDRQHDNQIVQNLPFSGGYLSSSGSDQSPSSSNFKAPDRTGRIIFKLFDKDPSNLPGTLWAEILNWLSQSPSDIESYIRPGCVVLSIYLCMASMAWDELEEDFLQRVCSLVSCSESGFWKNGRFLVCTSRQYVTYKDGKLRLCKSWRTLTSPLLSSISPIAVVSGQETTLLLKGRNFTVPGTTIHCTYKGGYLSKEVLGSTYPGTIYDDFSLEYLVLPTRSPFSYGRYFIEVDNGFKGNTFPIIVADAAICQELRSVESELDEDISFLDKYQHMENERPQSREDILHFLNELGWLFQRSHLHTSIVNFSTSRLHYLFTFCIERDFSALVRKLLDILVERSKSDSVLHEFLNELQLLSRAVKRKCRKMVDLLLNYSIKDGITVGSRVYLFPPNSTGPGGLTSLHLAASMQHAQDMVDALTNDPQEIGLNFWASALDDSGQSPFMYASSSRNYSYNILVARKLADKRNGEVSISIEHGKLSPVNSLGEANPPAKHGNSCSPTETAVSSCRRCALVESRLVRISRSKGLLGRPYVRSMLAIAAVCVCVCLFLRGAPWVGSIAPFKWESLDFGPR